VARYTSDSKERVRDAVDMLDLVGSRTELRRTGHDSYSGLCPFHDERTPSFGVKPSDKVYYCFGCQARGDAFTFVQEVEGVDFKGALELLADRYGVQLELEAEDPAAAARRQGRERLLELLERTCGYYERYLWDSREAARAREYLLGRGLDEASLRQFRVGYAPSAWDRVLIVSRQRGFSERELYDAGLAQRSRERPGQIYDRFRSRITFPLADQRGRVLGFGARGMSEQQRPKYLNTSDNDVYHKGRHLFGTHLARASAAKTASVIVCEGYTDVIAMHQAGHTNTVGLMGTALTEEQLAELGRLAPTVILALDSDSAGQEAMLRAARLASQRRLELRVVPLPVGTDPAELLQREGAAAVQALVERAVAFIRFRVERILAAGELGTPQGRDRIVADLEPIFAELEPGAMRVELEKLVAARLELPEKTISQLGGRAGGARAGGDASRGAGPSAVAVSLAARERAERGFLALCIALPDRGREALAELDLEAHFNSELTRRAAEHLRSHLDSPASGVDDGDLAALLAELAVRAAQTPARPAQLEVERLQLELARLEREIASARASGSGGLSGLGTERRRVKEEMDRALAQELEQTAAARE
jgi:DNA primase